MICLSKLIEYCIIKGEHKTAEEKLKEYNDTLPTCTQSELGVFQVIEDYLRCFMERSKGNYDKSYEIAKSGLDNLDEIQPGIVSAEFYALAATVVNIVAMKTEDASKRDPLLSEAKDLFFKALRHLQDVRKSKFVKADLEQKVYTNFAMFLSGSCLAGSKPTNFHALDVDQTEAQNQLDIMNRIVIYENIAPSRYRETQHRLAQSDVLFLASCTSKGAREKHLLKQALKFAEQAKDFAEVGNFKEMFGYAESRITLIQKQEIGNALDILYFAPA